MIVNLLGEFQILEEDKVIDEQKIKSERLIRLFVILIMNRTRVVTSTELVEALWFNEEIENPIGALKNLIYRLRMILSKTISEQNFILTRRGGYCWNPEIRIETDIDQFDDMILELRRDNRKEAEKCYYLEQAQTIYIGDFLKHHSDWNWILPINSYYHSQYLSIARQLAEIYLGERQFDKLEVFMKKALLIEPYEEQLHIYLIKALLYQNKKQLAIEYYEKSKKMLCDTLGITVLLEFERLQKELYSLDHNKQVMNLLEIRNTMEEE